MLTGVRNYTSAHRVGGSDAPLLVPHLEITSQSLKSIRMSVTKAWGGGLGSGYQCVCMVSILKGGSREVQIRERNCRVSTTSPRILRSDVGASLGKGTLSGSSQRQAGAHQTTHLSAEEGKGRGRGGEPEGWQPPTYRP